MNIQLSYTGAVKSSKKLGITQNETPAWLSAAWVLELEF